MHSIHKLYDKVAMSLHLVRMHFFNKIECFLNGLIKSYKGKIEFDEPHDSRWNHEEGQVLLWSKQNQARIPQGMKR